MFLGPKRTIQEVLDEMQRINPKPQPKTYKNKEYTGKKGLLMGTKIAQTEYELNIFGKPVVRRIQWNEEKHKVLMDLAEKMTDSEASRQFCKLMNLSLINNFRPVIARIQYLRRREYLTENN